jgi:hypothetical protein
MSPPAAVQHTSVIMYSNRQFCPTSAKFVFYCKISLTDPNVKLNSNPSIQQQPHWYMRADGQTDRRMGMTKLTGALRHSYKRAYKYPPLLCLFKAVLSATQI